jgi:hypothetical protein
MPTESRQVMMDISDALSYRLLQLPATVMLNILLEALSVMEQYNGRSVEEVITAVVGDKGKDQLMREYL